MNKVIERISGIGIVPVVRILQAEDAVPLAGALLRGGIDVAEITFRSEHAEASIAAIRQAYPDMLVGAGTVLSTEQAEKAVAAGAAFIVTPGFNGSVAKWCLSRHIPILPGISTASEIETALSYGITEVKFFPAESSGGAKKIKDLGAPYQQISFLPTGGINEGNLHDYLSLPNVLAVGGSFMLPEDAVLQKDWARLQSLSEQAVSRLLGYELIHLGINQTDSEKAEQTARLLCQLFHFTYYKKPKSHFAGRGFEILNTEGRGEHGHIGIYTPYPERAMYQLHKMGISFLEDTVTRNKKTNRINFVFLDLDLAGFGIHLINPDVKM